MRQSSYVMLQRNQGKRQATYLWPFEYDAATDQSGAARVRRATEAAEYTLTNIRNVVGPDVMIVFIGYPVFMDNTWTRPELNCPLSIDDNDAAYPGSTVSVIVSGVP